MIDKLRSMHLLFIALGAALVSTGLGLPAGSKSQFWLVAVGGGLGTFGGVLARGWQPLEVKAAMEASKPAGGSSPPAALALLLLPLLALSACAHIKAIGVSVAACTIGQLPSAVASIVPDVTAALGGSAVDWQGQLAGIGARSGLDALKCAIQAIIAEMTGHKSALDAAALLKIDRANVWLATH